MSFRFAGLNRTEAGIERNDGSRVMCQKCQADAKARKLRGETHGKNLRTRSRAATWQGHRVEGDGRKAYIAYCDEHFHWWNKRRLETSLGSTEAR